MSERSDWPNSSHEKGVEKFYGTGVANYGDHHGGFLNFGYWRDPRTGRPIEEYERAAENLIRHMAELAGLNASSKLLDVACGMGSQDVYLMKTFRPERIEAVDVTWPHVIRARERVGAAGFEERIGVSHGTGTALPFPDGSFTAVICVEGAEHMDTREDFLRDAFRVLKPGGRIVLADYSLHRRPETLIEKLFVWAGARLWHVPKANIQTMEEYRASLERAGFRNASWQEIGRDVLPGYYREQKRTIHDVARIRGAFAGYLGFIIDVAVYHNWKRGLMEYVIVKAEKP